MNDNPHWTARSLAHVWHPCTQMHDHAGGADANIPLIPIRRAEGIWLEDFEGRRYIDAVSSWWTNIFGHRHPHLVVQSQAAKGGEKSSQSAASRWFHRGRVSRYR